MKVIFIGSDRNIFNESSAVSARMVDYGELFEELHIIVFTKQNSKFHNLQLAKNVWVYPTLSWCRWMYPFDASKIAKSITHNNGSDFVISAQDPFEAGLSAKRATEKTGAKLHIQIHTDFLSPFFKKQSLLNRLRLLISRKVLPNADGIRVVSERIKNSLLSDQNYKLKVSLVVLPIYVERKNYEKATPFDFRHDHPDWNFVIFSAGRLEKEKNFALAIKTLKIVCQKYPKVGLVIAGKGTGKTKLSTLTEMHGLSKNVSIISAEDKDIPGFYKGVDIYLQTSNFEGFGMAVTEAAYAGTPVVMTDVGVAGWLLKDGDNAEICPIGDAKCLASAITHLIEDNGLRERLRGVLFGGFGKELPQSREEYLQKFKESIENCLKN